MSASADPPAAPCSDSIACPATDEVVTVADATGAVAADEAAKQQRLDTTARAALAQ
jgi:hypothetical protein